MSTDKYDPNLAASDCPSNQIVRNILLMSTRFWRKKMMEKISMIFSSCDKERRTIITHRGNGGDNVGVIMKGS